ncbi:hypothetical protein [Bacteroides sp.]|uniref:hypothetical protein n=1 Tax=Bacteroides sp. TaxID=29523 RepID=UPI0025C39513|nr:hypothetical protein [Bacteroides sp.]
MKQGININLKSYYTMKHTYLLVIALLLSVIVLQEVNAQTYSYKYLYSVNDDGVKVMVLGKDTKFFFTFSNNKRKCFLTDKNGVYSGGYGQNSYEYIGTKNDMLIYKECNQNMFHDTQDMLYFSSNYSRLNWKSGYDEYSPNNSNTIRVLQFMKDPDEEETPSQLY